MYEAIADPQVNLTPRVAADHLGLEGVQLGRARDSRLGIGFELALERLVGLVFVDVQSQSGSHQSVEDREFPVLFVVDLAVAGDGVDIQQTRDSDIESLMNQLRFFSVRAVSAGATRQRIASQRIEPASRSSESPPVSCAAANPAAGAPPSESA